MKPHALDAADIRILSALQRHGQLSKSQLAELAGLSSTPCWARYARLKTMGLIRGYHADLAIGKIVDVSKVIVTVSLKSHRKADFQRFEAQVHQHPEITECAATGGGMDYVMTVVTTSLTAFQDLLDEIFSDDFGIDRYMTYIVTREVKSAEPDIARLFAARKA